MERFYILDGVVPVPAASRREWVLWMEHAGDQACVAETTLHGAWLSCEVSTVFGGMLFLDATGAPVFFETRVRGGPLHGTTQAYGTWAQAVAGHADLVQACTEAMTAHDLDGWPVAAAWRDLL